jgi:hypothetical protein
MGTGMDELALRYLLLALRIGRLIDGFVDGYCGPSQLREAVASEDPAPPEELHGEAIALQELSAELTDGTRLLAQRRLWLQGQLVAMSALCRHMAGEEIAFVELVDALCETRAEPVPEDAFSTARSMLDDLLPSGPSLRERLEAHDRAIRVPADRKHAAIVAMADVLRARTLQELWLPAGEEIEWREVREVREVRDRPYGAHALSLGGLRTRITINLDSPIGIGEVVSLAAREAYPGHHTERVTKEAILVREARMGEAQVNCLFTPELALSEGLAEQAREVVLSDEEMGFEVRRLARRLDLPIEAASIEREVRATGAREVLRSATVTAALKLLHGGEPEAAVREWLGDTALMSRERIDHQLLALRDPLRATVPFASRLGPTLIREWLEVQGQTRGFARLLSEELSPRQLRAEMGEARALYPADFV